MNVCMAVGQAAGEAAAMAVEAGINPEHVNVEELRSKLLKKKAILKL